MESAIVEQIYELLRARYPEARAELHFSNPYETLVATILSAQCTDRRVNAVTEDLFKRYPNAEAMARADTSVLEEQIRSCGLYRMKAKNIIAACKEISLSYDGKVPDTREALMKLPGVGQKTAGVVLLAAFGEQQIPVDTHVFRVSNRIGLASADTPEKIEAQLRKILPREIWSHMHHVLIWHGRRTCHARKPDCLGCPLGKARICQSADAQ